MNLERERSERRILRLLELISLTQAAVQRHQEAVEPTRLTLNEFEDLLDRYKTELANLLAGYGLRYIPEVRQAA